MTRRWIALAAAGSCLAAPGAFAETCPGTAGGPRLEILVENVRTGEGQLTASIYPGDRGQFLVKNGALKVWHEPAREGVTRMCYLLPGPGTYALAVYDDANGNGRWDHRLGAAIEGIGFSNNPFLLFSKPAYDKVKFEAGAAGVTLHVRLHYP
jgi:uncharacterized protein (DUF2141 family)